MKQILTKYFYDDGSSIKENSVQILTSLLEIVQGNTPISLEVFEKRMNGHFRSYIQSFGTDLKLLEDKGYITKKNNTIQLTEKGRRIATRLAKEYPPLWFWYSHFYIAAFESKTHHEFCKRLYGNDMAQHGFTDMDQLDQLLSHMDIRDGDSILDMGCGNGKMDDFIHAKTHASVLGIDFIPVAIEQARKRTSGVEGLLFEIKSMDDLDYPRNYFNHILALDTLYMPLSLEKTMTRMKEILKPSGHIGITYSIALWEDSSFTKKSLAWDHTPIALMLQKLGMEYIAVDVTEEDLHHAELKLGLAEELKDSFISEGNEFMYTNRIAEARGVIKSIQAGAHKRYIYCAEKK